MTPTSSDLGYLSWLCGRAGTEAFVLGVCHIVPSSSNTPPPHSSPPPPSVHVYTVTLYMYVGLCNYRTKTATGHFTIHINTPPLTLPYCSFSHWITSFRGCHGCHGNHQSPRNRREAPGVACTWHIFMIFLAAEWFVYSSARLASPRYFTMYLVIGYIEDYKTVRIEVISWDWGYKSVCVWMTHLLHV